MKVKKALRVCQSHFLDTRVSEIESDVWSVLLVLVTGSTSTTELVGGRGRSDLRSL